MTKKKEVKLEAPTEVEQELIPFDPNQIVEFNPLEAQMAELRESNSKAVFDYADRKGNKEARSHINTIRLTKGVVERTRVAAKEKALEYGRAVDARAKEIVAELDGMIEVHAKPLQEIEQKEKARVERHEASIRSLSNYCTFAHTTTAEVWAVELKRVELFSVDDSLEEFLLQAAIAKRQALTEIKARLQARQTYEAEQEELRCLRVAAEKQKQIDREREIREEAAAEATRQAEAKATREKEQREREERNRIAAEEQRERDRLVGWRREAGADLPQRAPRVVDEATAGGAHREDSAPST